MLSGLFICLSACQQDYTKLGVRMGHFSVDLEKRMDHGIFFISFLQDKAYLMFSLIFHKANAIGIKMTLSVVADSSKKQI